MKIQDITGVIDRTAGDADTTPDTVIIHDLVGGQPSIIAYDADIEFALEELVGPLPEGYEHLPEEYANAWIRGNDQGTIDGFEGATGARIEHFEDFIFAHAGQWSLNGLTMYEEPEWTYPDDLLRQAN